MRQFFLTCLVMIFSATAHAAPTQDALERHCRDKWGTDYEMVQYCINEESSAAAFVRDNRDAFPPEVLTHCSSKWDVEATMLKYCINQQVTAGVFLNKNQDRFSPEILNTCMNKWEPEYTMVKYCAEQQQEAKDRIGRR